MTKRCTFLHPFCHILPNILCILYKFWRKLEEYFGNRMQNVKVCTRFAAILPKQLHEKTGQAFRSVRSFFSCNLSFLILLSQKRIHILVGLLNIMICSQRTMRSSLFCHFQNCCECIGIRRAVLIRKFYRHRRFRDNNRILTIRYFQLTLLNDFDVTIGIVG